MLVLLLGEIDLSVGSVSGLSAAILAVLFVNHGWPLVVAHPGRAAAARVIGIVYGVLYTRFGVPSFVITLAGCSGFLGPAALGARQQGHRQPARSTPALVKFARSSYLACVASYVLVVLRRSLVYAALQLAPIRRRTGRALRARS